MSVVLAACVTGPFLLPVFVEATSNSTGDTDLGNTQKALITVAVLGGCIIIALVIAKLVDYCYDHHVAINDDASDISEHTRNLIRSRLAVKAFRSKKKPGGGAAVEPHVDISAKQSKIIRIWSAKAKESRKIAEQRRAQDQAKVLAGRADLVIRVEEASGEAKLKASLAAPSASLTFESENSDKDPGPSDSSRDQNEAGSSRSRSPFLIRPELKRTLTGLDSSNKIAEAPAMVAVSASGNTSVLPVKGSPMPVLPVKESSSKEQAASSGEDGVDTFRSDTEGELAILTDRTDHGHTPEAKSSQPDRPGGSKTPEPKSQKSVSPKPGRAASKSPSPNSPAVKTESPDPPKPKPEGVKSPGVPVTRSPSPAHKAVKQNAQTRAASPTKPSTTAAAKKTESPPEKLKGDKQGSPETPREESSAGGDKRDSSPSPTRSPQPRPTSSLSRKLFTVVRPTDHPAPTKSQNRSPEPKPATSSQNITGAFGKARPKSFHAKDSDKFTHLPKKLASSVALYGKATDDLDKHKAVISKKRTAVSPSRPVNQAASPPPGKKKLVQSPIVLAAAARKARIKSAKPGGRVEA